MRHLNLVRVRFLKYWAADETRMSEEQGDMVTGSPTTRAGNKPSLREKLDRKVGMTNHAVEKNDLMIFFST